MALTEQQFLMRAIELSRQGMNSRQGGPFGCVIVRNNEIIAEGCNEVAVSNDPTAHAEIVAIRNACQNLGNFQLTDCDVYCSCEPCPMCLGAIYWARPRSVIFANTKQDAAAIGFDDHLIYDEIEKEPTERQIPFTHLPQEEARKVFEEWKEMPDKNVY